MNIVTVVVCLASKFQTAAYRKCKQEVFYTSTFLYNLVKFRQEKSSVITDKKCLFSFKISMFLYKCVDLCV